MVVLKYVLKLPINHQLALEERKVKKALRLTQEMKTLETTSKI